MPAEKPPAWCRPLMTSALSIMRDRNQECLPAIFVHTKGRLEIAPLDMDKALWPDVVRQIVKQTGADAVAMIAASYLRAVKPGEAGEVVFPIRNDIQSESAALFTLKEKGRPTRTWQSKYEHLDGRVIRAAEFEFSQSQPVYDRIFDGAFDEPKPEPSKN